MKVLLHVNYYEKPGGLDKLFSIAEEFGYDGVELRWIYPFDDMSQDEYQEKIISLKKQYPGFEITFGGEIDFCRGGADTIEDETSKYLDFMEWAKRELNTKVMNFFTGTLANDEVAYFDFHINGSTLATKLDYENSAKGLKAIGEKAAQLDMLVAVETHNCYLHDLPQACCKLMDMTNHDCVGINIDYGNIVLNQNKCSISEAVEALGSKIYYGHLKNALTFNNTFMITHLDQGCINNMELLELIKDKIKSGILALEYPDSGDGIRAAQKDMQYMKFLMERLSID